MRCRCESDAFDCDNEAVSREGLCETCGRICRPNRPPIRYAEVAGVYDLRSVRAYLPSNYTATEIEDRILISGRDDHGWTLDGYVIPRLASGLIAAREVKK